MAAFREACCNLGKDIGLLRLTFRCQQYSVIKVDLHISHSKSLPYLARLNSAAGKLSCAAHFGHWVWQSLGYRVPTWRMQVGVQGKSLLSVICFFKEKRTPASGKTGHRRVAQSVMCLTAGVASSILAWSQNQADNRGFGRGSFQTQVVSAWVVSLFWWFVSAEYTQTHPPYNRSKKRIQGQNFCQTIEDI